MCEVCGFETSTHTHTHTHTHTPPSTVKLKRCSIGRRWERDSWCTPRTSGSFFSFYLAGLQNWALHVERLMDLNLVGEALVAYASDLKNTVFEIKPLTKTVFVVKNASV